MPQLCTAAQGETTPLLLVQETFSQGEWRAHLFPTWTSMGRSEQAQRGQQTRRAL